MRYLYYTRVNALEAAGRAVVEANYETSGAPIEGKQRLWTAIADLESALGPAAFGERA